MEFDVVVELVVYVFEYGVFVVVFVGDDDICIIKKVRESVSYDVIKWFDIVYVKRLFVISFYVFQKNYKGSLSGKVINYLLMCFGYVLF